MAASDDDPVVLHLRTEIQRALREGLRTRGLAEPAQLQAEMARRQRRGLDFVPERTWRRYLDPRSQEGIPVEPKETSQRSLATLAELAGVGPAVSALCQELWEYGRSRGSRRAVARGTGHDGLIPSEWFAVIPRQGSRRYASIDRVRITMQEHESVSGTIVRIDPPRERGLRWEFSGTRQGIDALFLTFRPLDATNPSSRGSMALRRVDYRPLRYRGTYTRLDGGSSANGFLTREVAWHPQIPLEAFRRVALLDLDNTLRADWSLRHWLRFLARNGLAGVAEQARHIEKEIVDRFLEGHIDHDELARRAAEAYAAVMRNQRVEEVDDWAAVFVQGPGARSIHGFAKTLVDHLIVKGIAPVIVSGAPHEIVQRHARRLGIVEAFGLRLGTTTEDGVLRFDGTIADNPGIAVRKRAIVRTLMEEEREIVLAVGDSESDQPLWDAAPLRIVVGERVLPDESDAERTLTLHPERTTWPEIAQWLDARLPEETTDAGRGLVFGPLAAGDEPGTIRLPDLGEPGRILPAGIPSSSQGRARG